MSTQDVGHDRVVVTGGGSGIGRAVAVELARRGCEVWAAGRREGPLHETADLVRGEPGKVWPFPADACDPEAVEGLFAAAGSEGPVTGVVHAAAQITLAPAEVMSPTQFAATVDSTLVGAFNVLHRWGRELVESGTPGAAVALTSSTCVEGSPGISHSGAGKAGLTSLARSLGREWGPHGVRVNCVGPGAFPVEKSQRMFAEPEVRAYQFEQIPLGRYGELGEIVEPILFLLGPGASYVTGQTLVVDGGQTLGHWPIPRSVLDRGMNNQY